MEIKKIRYDLILVDETQIRKEFPDQQSLTKSILKNGLIEPLKVRKEKDKYRLVDGERRYRSIIDIIKKCSDFSKLIDCIVLPKPKNKTITQLITDIHKHKISPFEEAGAYKRLIEDDCLTISEVAVLLGIKKQHVQGRLKLLAFDDESKKLIEDNKLSVSVAQSLDIRTIKENPEVIRKIASEGANFKRTKQILLEDERSYFRLLDGLFKRAYSIKNDLIQLDNILEKLSKEKGINSENARKEVSNCRHTLENLNYEVNKVYNSEIKERPKYQEPTIESVPELEKNYSVPEALSSEELDLLSQMKEHKGDFDE